MVDSTLHWFDSSSNKTQICLIIVVNTVGKLESVCKYLKSDYFIIVRQNIKCPQSY